MTQAIRLLFDSA